MLSDDVEMLMCHCRNSLHANGELLGAMTRIKKDVEELAQLSHNSVSTPCPAFQPCRVCQISSSSVCGTVPCTIARHA